MPPARDPPLRRHGRRALPRRPLADPRAGAARGGRRGHRGLPGAPRLRRGLPPPGDVRRRRVARPARGARGGPHLRRRAEPRAHAPRARPARRRRGEGDVLRHRRQGGRAPRARARHRRARARRRHPRPHPRPPPHAAHARRRWATISPRPSPPSRPSPARGRRCSARPWGSPARAWRARWSGSIWWWWAGRCAGSTASRGARPERVAARVVPRLADGAIVLLHDAAERDDFCPASLAALPRILAAMRARDLEGVRARRLGAGRRPRRRYFASASARRTTFLKRASGCAPLTR